MSFIETKLGPIYFEDTGDQTQPVALLWPSLFTDHSMYAAQIPLLHELGFRTIVIDPPGHGKSLGVNRLFTMDECVDIAFQLLDSRGVNTPVLILGTSWGGMVGMRMALRSPERVKGMILFSSTADMSTAFEKIRGTLLTTLLNIKSLDSLVDKMLSSLQLSAETRANHPEISPELNAKFRSWGRTNMIKTVRSVLIERDDLLERLKPLTAPVLTVTGKDDSLLPAPHSLRIVKRVVNGSHMEVAGAAHIVPLEQPEISNKIIIEFIKNLH